MRLDSREGALLGGDSGAAVVPGHGARSELIRRVTSPDPKRRMPLGSAPLSAAQIDLLRRWIDSGAGWAGVKAPDAGKPGGRGARGTSNSALPAHWSFRRIRRPEVPQVKHRAVVRNPIDAFLLAKLEGGTRGAGPGLAFSPPADDRTLIRRLSLDLTGLPPTPEEVEAFVRECETSGPPAYDRVVDRLLASPHFGERWGRHWLDLARYAESDGYENDRLRPDAWRYRDWVVEALNRDMPFDQFTIEQLAGDLLEERSGVATGFHRNTLWNSAASADKEEFRTLAVKDRADTTATAWMGLTLGCAKCHSHKYDPVTQQEYYRFYAFFDRTDDQEVAVPGGKAPALRAVPRTSYVHLRGNFLQKGEEVLPGTPGFLPPLKPRGPVADRLDLARWLVDPAHPLTARVAADRVWRHLFGQGLVPTSDDFGTRGERPTHPELMDWLANEFVAPSLAPPPSLGEGPGMGARPWSLKSLIRLIVTSTAYRQSSRVRPELARRDPGNALLGRQNRFRVEAEIVRDLALAASGLLDRRVGGPSVVPPFPPGLLDQKVTSEALKLPEEKAYRRGLYVHVQRTLTHPTLAVFDGPDGNQPCVRRERSTTPIQALTLLNDPVYVECARALGGRLRAASAEPGERLRFGFQLCLARPPDHEELAALTALVRTQRELGAGEEAVWNGVARALLNLDEFITRE